MTPAQVLVADPPWPLGDFLPGPGRGAEKHYPTMSIEHICRFPLPRMLPKPVLFLWRVASMQEEAFQVMRAWGYRPQGGELVWEKLTSTGKKAFGMGRVVRASHEVCLIGIRAVRAEYPRPRVSNVRSVFSAPVGEHSSKPDKFYELVESLYHGPYVELFARRERPGWDCYGDELARSAPRQEY